jgi:hypothetical protein
MEPNKAQCKNLYDANKAYVEKNIDSLHHTELYLMATKKDALYLAWSCGDYSKLGY